MSDDWKPKRRFVDPTRLTRKVFDRHVDRMKDLRGRDKEDYRADMKAIFQRMQNLENQLTLLIREVEENTAHLQSHCETLDKDTRDS